MILHNETEVLAVFILQHGEDDPIHEEVDLSLAGFDSLGIKDKSFSFQEHGLDMTTRVYMRPDYGS